MQAAKLLLVTIIVSFTLLVDFAKSSELASCYCDQVIYVETLRYPGRYLDAHHTKVALFTAPPGGDVTGLVWAKWTVRCGSDGAVALESVRYPDYYLDAHHSRDCKVTYSASTETYWNMWYMERRADGAVEFRSKRYPDSRLDAYHANNLAKVTRGSGVWSGMRIYQPNNIATQYYGEVINIETMRYPGRYLDAHHTKVALFTAPPGGDVSGLVWAEWTVRCGPEGTISLESVRYPDYYLDAHHSRNCKVTYSATPATYWNLWYMEKTDDGAIEFRSKRYPDSRLDAYHANNLAKVTPGSGIWSKMRVHEV